MDDLVAGDGELTEAALDKWAANAAASAAKLQRVAAATDHVQVTRSSPDNLVTVTVDASGNVTDLRIADRAMNGHGAKLAAHIMATMRQAQAGIASRMAEIVQATVGDDRTVVNVVLAKYHDKFPEPPLSPAPQAVTVQDFGGPPAQSPQQPLRISKRAPLRPRGTDERWNEDGGSVLEEIDT